MASSGDTRQRGDSYNWFSKDISLDISFGGTKND